MNQDEKLQVTKKEVGEFGRREKYVPLITHENYDMDTQVRYIGKAAKHELMKVKVSGLEIKVMNCLSSHELSHSNTEAKTSEIHANIPSKNLICCLVQDGGVEDLGCDKVRISISSRAAVFEVTLAFSF